MKGLMKDAKAFRAGPHTKQNLDLFPTREEIKAKDKLAKEGEAQEADGGTTEAEPISEKTRRYGISLCSRPISLCRKRRSKTAQIHKPNRECGKEVSIFTFPGGIMICYPRIIEYRRRSYYQKEISIYRMGKKSIIIETS